MEKALGSADDDGGRTGYNYGVRESYEVLKEMERERCRELGSIDGD